MVAPSSLPTITSSSGSHSLCEFTGETCPAGAASGPIARVIMSIARRLLGLQQSRVLEVPREGGTRSAGDELANLRLGRLVALNQRIRAASTEAVDHEFFNPTSLQSQTPLSPPPRCRAIRAQTAQGRTRCRRMAGRHAGALAGRGALRTNDIRAHRYHESVEPW